jgi:hypothetical protein
MCGGAVRMMMRLIPESTHHHHEFQNALITKLQTSGIFRSGIFRKIPESGNNKTLQTSGIFSGKFSPGIFRKIPESGNNKTANFRNLQPWNLPEDSRIR